MWQAIASVALGVVAVVRDVINRKKAPPTAASEFDTDAERARINKQLEDWDKELSKPADPINLSRRPTWLSKGDIS